MLLTRTITKRAVARVGSVQPESQDRSIGHVECPKSQTGIFVEWKAPNDFFTQETSTLIPAMFIFIVCKLLLHLKCLKHTET